MHTKTIAVPAHVLPMYTLGPHQYNAIRRVWMVNVRPRGAGAPGSSSPVMPSFVTYSLFSIPSNLSITVPAIMCSRYVYTESYVNCTATPKHVITTYDPQPPCGKADCGGYKDVNFGKSTKKGGREQALCLT
ncbi:hypothetical protein T440DRAFT_473843 [Plenodomus tracheiphilus IPT5]|uniref:Uncharacterized protein n=1 Tax=Plenodomus tracheiphilus IPT5 TaxID=1408161 RepID=A0A6A7ALC6_9PLEO|nr:hypothetical protein T440DRAFT_473843 [Plenodomus tracheiphilus IPT5]